MDKSYPIFKIFNIEGLIWSFNIEVIGPATYVCCEDAASTVGITIATFSVRRGLMRGDYPWAASLDRMQDLRRAPGPAVAKIQRTADPQCPGGDPRASPQEVVADSVIRAAAALQASAVQAVAHRV